MMHIYRTHFQPDIAICVKGKKETGVIFLTHNYRGIWGEEGERMKIRWAVFLCAGQHAGSPMPSKLLSSQAERRSGIWTRASPVSAYIPKARHKWSGQLPVYSPCTSTHGEVNGRQHSAFIEPFLLSPSLAPWINQKSSYKHTTFILQEQWAFLSLERI